MQPDGSFDTILRQHDTARPCLGRRGKRGHRSQAFGRSRGGLPTKIHLRTDLDGNPLDVPRTGGEASDSKQFETSLDIGPGIRPRITMTDKGHDSQANRVAARARGITPAFPSREDSGRAGRFFPKRLHKPRARIEQTSGKPKRFKRVAMRREKTDISYSAIVGFACGLMPVKSVHATWDFRSAAMPDIPHGVGRRCNESMEWSAMHDEPHLADSHSVRRLTARLADMAYRDRRIEAHTRQILARHMGELRGRPSRAEFGPRIGGSRTVVS